jgi:D-sedoheptulose 7-phosphate isomerase
MTFSSYCSSLFSVINSQNEIIYNQQISQLANLIIDADHQQGITVIFGNGGSAADAQHWAAELICSYHKSIRKPIKALALTTDSSVITAWANDFSFDSIFKRQIDAYSHLIRISIGLSTSGTSKNVLQGLKSARSYGSKTILISGSCCSYNESVDMHVQFDTSETGIIQTLTQIFYHSVCIEVESKLLSLIL